MHFFNLVYASKQRKDRFTIDSLRIIFMAERSSFLCRDFE